MKYLIIALFAVGSLVGFKLASAQSLQGSNYQLQPASVQLQGSSEQLQGSSFQLQ